MGISDKRRRQGAAFAYNYPKRPKSFRRIRAEPKKQFQIKETPKHAFTFDFHLGMNILNRIDNKVNAQNRPLNLKNGKKRKK